MSKKADLTGLTDDSVNRNSRADLNAHLSDSRGDQSGLKPRLRFPEFLESGEWEERLLEDVLSPVVRQKEKPAQSYIGLGVRSHGKGTFLKPFELPEKNAMEYLYEVQSKDLIVNITFAWEGAIAIVQEVDSGALVSHRFPTYTFEKNIAIPEFFQYIIVDKQFIYKLGVISPGGAGRNRVLNKNDFLKLKALIPSLPEQQKIAKCLTSLDELIAAERARLEALKAYKKGLLQNLFPAEGESTPKLRFPEFAESGEWEKKPLKAVANIIAGQSPDGSYYNDNGIGMPFYQGKTDFGDIYINNPTKWTTQVTKVAESGDILMSVRAPVGALNVSTSQVCIGRGLAAIQANQNKWYLYYFLNRIQETIVGNGGAIFDSINKNQIEEISVFIPSLPEQQKIAGTLIALDEQIAAQSQRLAALQSHKKGLLQGMFP